LNYTRLYHFLSAKNAIDDLKRGRLKLSEIDKLNDPFELWCSSQEDAGVRNALIRFQQRTAEVNGILCFCERWSNPLLWSHYADKHCGVCLGFDVDREAVEPVKYVSRRQQLPPRPTQATMLQLLYTKYRGWSYEKEWRAWFQLDARDGDHYFYDFDDRIDLREVIAGALCSEQKTLVAAARAYSGVSLTQARLAFRSFRIVIRKNARLG